MIDEIKEWLKVKEQLNKLKAKELELRSELAYKLKDNPTIPGVKYKVTIPEYTNVDTSEFLANQDKIIQFGINPGAIVKTELKLVNSEYKKLTDEQKKLIDCFLTIRQTKPQITIKFNE